MAGKDQGRRRLVLVELAEERFEHHLGREILGMTRKISPVAVVLTGAEEEHLDAGRAAGTVERDHGGGAGVGGAGRGRLWGVGPRLYFVAGGVPYLLPGPGALLPD